MFNFYSEPVYVTGSSEPHALWNENGRKIVHNFIRKSLCSYLGKNRVYFGS